MNFEDYFQNRSLLKTPHLGVHYEQKTTPDLLWAVALGILDVTKNDRAQEFTDNDIRESLVYQTLMRDYFSKAPQENAENEYNKLSSYQLGVLVFSSLLEQTAERPKRYRVRELPSLEYIASNDFSAAKFLSAYTEKFLRDNGLLTVFEAYRENPIQENYERAKETYWQWARIHTNVRGDDPRHTRRVFNKVFNVYCYTHRVPGELGSQVTTGPCSYSYLIYNRENFRDKDKPQGMTREEYREIVMAEVDVEGVVETLLKKAKEAVKSKYSNDSEIKDIQWGYATERVVEVHHILPRHSYQQFSLSKENLIVLTPDQHRSFAHNGNYRTVNSLFQAICLKAKSEHITTSIGNGEDFYALADFVSIVNTCYGWELSPNISIEMLRERINQKIQELS